MGSSSTEQYCLRWNDFHANVANAFSDIRDEEDFLDVTLVSDGQIVRAHKLVLSACSPMFRTMLKKNDHPKPIIFLHGVRYSDIKAILNFMYRGEVNINQEDLNTFLAAAEELRVRGLSQSDLQDRMEDRANISTQSTAAVIPVANKVACQGTTSVDSSPEKRPRLDSSNFGGQHESRPTYPSPVWKNSAPSPAHCRSTSFSAHDDPPNHHSRVVPPTSKNNEPRNLIVTPPDPIQPRDSPSPLDTRVRGGLTRERSVGSSNAESMQELEFDEQRRRSEEKAFFAGRSPSVLEGFSSSDLSFHSLGGRDTGDPLSKITVALSPKGWHCPECLHISTTKGNLKSHILSGRHKLFEKSFMCSFCRKTYSTRQSLQVHISTHHRQERDRDGVLAGVVGSFPTRQLSQSSAGGTSTAVGRYEDFSPYDDQHQSQSSSSPYHVKTELDRHTFQSSQQHQQHQHQHFSHRLQEGGNSFDNPDTDESRDDSSGGGGGGVPYGVPRNDQGFMHQTGQVNFDH